MNLKNKRFLVTGGAGFLGSHVVEELKRMGVKKIFIPRSKKYDLVKSSDVKKVFDISKPDIVIHLAATVGGIGANRKHPGKFFYDNIMMGAHMIEEARKTKVLKFVQLGTVCAYPKFTPVPFLEKNLWDGYPEETNAPYGIAKKSLLVMLQGYRLEYGFNGIFLLPVNLYGPRDNFDPKSSHVIPALIKKMVDAERKNCKEVEIWGTGKASREFLYVKDCARAIILATQRYDKPEPVNIGAGFEITIKDLVKKIQKLTGYSGKLIWDRSKPDGQPRRSLNTSKAKKEFGFIAKTKFDQGLKNTIEWYRDNY